MRGEIVSKRQYVDSITKEAHETRDNCSCRNVRACLCDCWQCGRVFSLESYQSRRKTFASLSSCLTFISRCSMATPTHVQNQKDNYNNPYPLVDASSVGRWTTYWAIGPGLRMDHWPERRSTVVVFLSPTSQGAPPVAAW